MGYIEFLSEHGATLLLGTVMTLKVLICSIILYVIISMIFGLMRLSKNPIIQGTATVYIEFFRGTSLLVQLFWVYYVLPFFGISLEAFTAGVVALGLNFGAYGAEIVRGGILAVPKGQWEAAESLAFSRLQVLWKIILPQCFKRMIPPWMNWYAILTMATPLCSLLGVEEIITLSRQAMEAENNHPELLIPFYSFALALFFIYCYPIAKFTVYLEKKYSVKL